MSIPSVNLTIVEGALGIPPEQTDDILYIFGHCTLGTVGTVYSFDQSSPTDVKTALGVGKAAELAASVLQNIGHGQVNVIPCTATTAGSNSAVSSSGTSPPTVTLSGAPVDDFVGIVQIVTGGARGTATFKYSLDNGNTWSAEIATAATYLMVYPDGSTSTGVTLNFATGTNYSSDNKYTFTCTAPLCTNSDIAAGLDVLVASGADFGWLYCIGPDQGTLDTDRTTAMASRFSAISAYADTFETKYKYIGVTIEAPYPVGTSLSGLATWRSALQGASPALTHKRMMIVAGRALTTSDLSGLQILRPGGWQVIGRLISVPIDHDLGRVRDGALRGTVVSLEHDEEATGGLDSSRYTTLRTIAGRQGFWITQGRMFEVAGGDYQFVQALRIINRGAKALRNALLGYLNEDLIVDKSTGKIRSDEADAIDADLTSQMLDSVGKYVSDAFGRVGRNDNILTTSTLSGEGGIQLKGYAKFINFKLGLVRTTTPAAG